jgi:hypothetical protein
MMAIGQAKTCSVSYDTVNITSTNTYIVVFLTIKPYPLGHTLYVLCNIETHSHSHHCCGKAISSTYSECVSSLSYQACTVHALYYIVICGLSGGIFFTLSHEQHKFKTYFDFLSICVKYFGF